MAKLVNEIQFSAPHKKGVLASINQALGENSVNIVHIGACGSGKKAWVNLVTNRDPKAMAVLRRLGYRPKAEKVVLLNITNKAGKGVPYFKKLAKAGINIKSVMATSGGGNRVSVILNTNNNRKAVRVL